MQLQLYITAHCHLCELASKVLDTVLPLHAWEDVEIFGNDILLQRYGTTIPVLKRLDTQQELCWPFDTEQVIEFLR